jgi:hypothetical protein
MCRVPPERGKVAPEPLALGYAIANVTRRATDSAESAPLGTGHDECELEDCFRECLKKNKNAFVIPLVRACPGVTGMDDAAISVTQMVGMNNLEHAVLLVKQHAHCVQIFGNDFGTLLRWVPVQTHDDLLQIRFRIGVHVVLRARMIVDFHCRS